MNLLITALVSTLAAQILTSLAGGTGPVLVPIVAADLGVATTLIGTYVAFVWSFAAIAGLAVGGFIIRFGAMRITQVGLVVIAAGMAVSALGTTWAVLVGAVLIGAATGMMTPASSHVLARVTPQQSMNFVFSAKQTGVPLGNALAGLMMPALALAYSWHAALLVGAVLSFVLAIGLQPYRERYDADRDPQRSLRASLQLLAPLRLVYGMPGLRRMIVMSFVYAGMQNSFGTFLVTYLHERLGMTLVLAGFIFTVGQTAGAIGRIVWAAVADRYVRPQMLLGVLGLAMSACALLTAAFTADWPVALVLAVSIAFGGTSVAWNGVYLAQVAILAPPGRVGDATGASAFCTFVGVVLFPFLFSLILAFSGSYALGFSLLAAVTLAVGAWLMAAPMDGKS